MKVLRPITALAASAAVVLLVPGSSAFAQRQQASPEQRLDRLERQMNELQRHVYPKGSPADTAGFSDEPAATQSSVLSLSQRLDSLERQMSDMLRSNEENGNRLRSMETNINQMRADDQQRIQALEQRMDAAAAAATPPAADAGEAASVAAPVKSPAARPSGPKGRASISTSKTSAAAAASDEPQTADASAPDDPGEDAYSNGFHLWEAGKYDEAVSTLRDFVKAYPKHRRVSYANNLIGRALLDNGQPRQAAEALLANYRSNPSGERAPDSLYYLGQALMKLGQTTQACKAYAELDAVYGAKVRPDLKKLEADAKSQAQCS
ncbi:MAG TPA: tetratricopeptide repeat protein [Sphingomicrobium sp.]|nr:tetratricopeptide repeat protein [Sphingomicrobium sp.]